VAAQLARIDAVGIELSAVEPGRVLLVDDQPAFLGLLAEVVGATSHLEVAGDAQSGERAVELTQELKPDMVLMDVRMPGIGGLEAAERIKAVRPSTLIVLVSTTHPDELPPRAHEVIWKSRLGSALLDDIWLAHLRASRRTDVVKAPR
jgi:chemotaxis response regulator CheB